jgi:hypothetical protein
MTEDYYNPFEYEAATTLSEDKIVDFYIEDYNYSRFIHSKRNIMLVGERGTGKSMALLYNSFPIVQKKAEKTGGKFDYDIVCVYVPCNTPLTHRAEYQLLGDFEASIVSEHFLVLAIMYAVVNTVSRIKNIMDHVDESQLKKQLVFILDLEIPETGSLFDGLKWTIQREMTKTQTVLNARIKEAFYNTAFSFSSGLLPLLNTLRKIPKLAETHFALMIDDAHDLNPFQVKALNSWIAYRDNSLFSFKVATTKVDQPSRITSSRGAILDGHDFTLIDMEKAYQSQYTDFGRLAREVVKKRLSNVGINKTPDEFFPISPELQKELQECEDRIRKKAEEKYPHGTKKQIADYVYKYARAEYFRSRSRRANRPQYSGFDTLVHISTGIIRNLLEPCWWMYDIVYSRQSEQNQKLQILEIPPSIQSDILLERSEKKWDWIKDQLDCSIDGCSREQKEQVYRLFNNLAILFRERLQNHESEPRAIVFTISEIEYEFYNKLEELLKIARKAQILYTRSGSAKDLGQRETYYVPNRILWPARGLDPNGQHARVSIKAQHLWRAAAENIQIPMETKDETEGSVISDMQGVLF